MTYCKKCGTMLREEKCPHCGADYRTDKLREVKQNIKRNIKSRYNVPSAVKTLVVVIIIALIVLVCYILFSSPQQRSTFFNTAQQTPNDNLKSQAAVTSQGLTSSVQSAVQKSGKPTLRVYHQMVNQIDFEKGCFGRVDGGVTNIGAKAAANVVVVCSTEDGVSVEKDLGDMNVLETKTFEILLNYNCDKMHTEECSANCDNC